MNVLNFSQAMSDHMLLANSKSKVNNEKEFEKEIKTLMYLAGFNLEISNQPEMGLLMLLLK